MRWLNDEEGASAVLVALILIPLVGMGALVIDVGLVYWEVRQLQNGADAAALAVAQDCAEGNCGDSQATADYFTDVNAADDAADATVLLPGLDGADSVTVTATTRTADGSDSLSYQLAGVLEGAFGSDFNATFERSATAVWGYPSSLGTIPLIISACEFNDESDIHPGPHPNAAVSSIETLLFHQGTGGDEDPCNAQAGHDVSGDSSLPAGFGWIDNNDNCEIVTTTVDGQQWVEKAAGNDPECSAAEFAALLNTVVQIPVFNDFCRPAHDPAPACPDYSNKDKYRIETYASFYLVGYRLGGGPAYRGGDYSECHSSERCIRGYFTTSTVPDGDLGGPEGGVIVVRLQG